MLSNARLASRVTSIKMLDEKLALLSVALVVLVAITSVCHSARQHDVNKLRGEQVSRSLTEPAKSHSKLVGKQQILPWQASDLSSSAASSPSSSSSATSKQQVLSSREARLINKRQSGTSGDAEPEGDEQSTSFPVASSRTSSVWSRPLAQTSANNSALGGASYHPQLRRSPDIGPAQTSFATPGTDVCSDRLCYGLPMGCLDRTTQGGSRCSVLVTSKYLIDPYRPVARDIHFELVALPVAGQSNYAAVGFSSTGRMAGLVSECLQYRDSNTKLQIITLAHSYNIPGAYSNVPVTILSGLKNLGVSFENGYFQCRWVVESAVEFTYEDSDGQLVNKREDLGYKNYHILLASGSYNERTNTKSIHTDRVSSMAPISLAQTGHIKSLGSHILIRIHGSLMIAIWIGLVTVSVLMARYYKNEWTSSKINDTAIWFIVHRAFMLLAWFGSIIAVIFAYMYTETYHPGLHQISGTTCLILSTIQVLGGLLRPSPESAKRIYFNWTHFLCGNLSYLCAMISIVSAAFLAPAHLPPIYIWVVVAFVTIYALTHLIMTIHQYVIHKSSKMNPPKSKEISITPMSDLNDPSLSNTYSSCGFIADSYPKEVNSTFRQVMLGILVTIVVIFIVSLISLVNLK